MIQKSLSLDLQPCEPTGSVPNHLPPHCTSDIGDTTVDYLLDPGVVPLWRMGLVKCYSIHNLLRINLLSHHNTQGARL